MNKLLKLVSVNLMGLVDYNGVLKEKEAGIKGKSEARLIIIGLASIVVGSVVYFLFNLLGEKVVNKELILFMGFLLTTILCFVVSIVQIGPIVFRSEDTEYLFSLPLTKHQIVFSKIFSIYIRTLLFVVIIMLPCILSYSSLVKVDETMSLIYIVNGLFIPFIPIMLSVLIFYLGYYIKFHWNKVVTILFKFLSLVILIIFVYLLFGGINIDGFNSVVNYIYERLRVIYFPSLLFVKSVGSSHVISFVLYIVINIVVIYFFMLFMLKNYIKICSLLKGIKNNKKFVYKDRIGLGRSLGTLRKELLFVIKNRLFFNGSYGIVLSISLVLVLACLIVPLNEIKNETFINYYPLFVPFILGGIISIGNSCINSISLEKNNVEMLYTLPMKIGTMIYYKWLANVVICGFIILVDATAINLAFKPDLFTIVSSYIFPIIVVMTISLISIVLDYRFVVKKENDDGVILKQRFISLVPTIISFVIIFVPIFFKAYMLYKYIVCSFGIICLLVMLVCGLYLLINHKKLRKNLIK